MADSELCDACSVLRLTDNVLGIIGMSEHGSPLLKPLRKTQLDSSSTGILVSGRRYFTWPDLPEFRTPGCVLCKFLRDILMRDGQNLSTDLKLGPMAVRFSFDYGLDIFKGGSTSMRPCFLQPHVHATTGEYIPGFHGALIASSDGTFSYIQSVEIKRASKLIATQHSIESVQRWTNLWREPSNITLSPGNIQFMRNSLRACESTCLEAIPSGFVPRRLVYLGRNMKDIPRLILTADTSPYSGRLKYAALSYSWGDKQDAATQLKTRRQNISGHLRAIPLASMTKVMQDAVHICHLLSISYIWIDALCIIQDDSKDTGFHGSDWDKESENMGLIFQNAHITLCAASSRSCHESFLERRLPSVKLAFRSDHDPSAAGTYSMTHLPGRTDDYDPLSLEDSHWWNRGWVFQEREMSARLLIFGELMMHFKCAYCKRSEIESVHHSAGLPILYAGMIRHLAEDPDTPTETFYDLYRDLAKTYSSKSLTYPSDRLPAISGFAKRICEITQGKYLGGLWEETLYRDLLWKGMDNPAKCNSLAELIALRSPSSGPLSPSWSWACWPGSHWPGLVYCHFIDRDHDVRPAYTEIEGLVKTVGSNPYGQIRDGRIKITTAARYFPWDGMYQIINVGGNIKMMHHASSEYFAHCSLDWEHDENTRVTTASPPFTPGVFLVLLSSSCTDVPSKVALGETSAPTNDGRTCPGCRLYERTDSNWCGTCNTFATKDNRNAWGLILNAAPFMPGIFIRVGIFTSRVGSGGGTDLFKGSSAATFEVI
ncbi:hypothetical protein NW762_013408 [Fusarium torreyae]|uniref:Heterokaryon incompatibility domain-containing protein n=1 Tax=Fusarium torreyae TaxID=1237075 RepID=A0A9W8RKQ3_9HYPO|nr:hypothetical protein NW762_013408 [Fusarium torreyae]